MGAPAQGGFQQIGIVGLGCRLLRGIGEGLFRIALRVHHGRFAILNLREGLHGRVLDRLPGRPLDRLLGLGRARRRALQHVPTALAGRDGRLLGVLAAQAVLVRIEALVESADERRGELAGVEVAQVVDALAHADLHDGQPQLVAHGQRDAAFGRAIELRDDKGVQIQRAVELAGLLQAVLARGGVDDEHRVHRQLRALAHHVHYFLQLAHEVGGGVQAPGRVDEHELGTGRFGALQRVVAHARRIGSALAGDHLHSGAARPHLKLLDGGGAEGVGRAQDDRATRIGFRLGELAHGGGLARAVDAHEQHHGLIAAEDVGPGLREGTGDLVVQEVEHRIGVGQRLTGGLVAQVLHDVAGRRPAHIRQDERFFQALPELLVQIGSTVQKDVHRLLELVARAGKPLADAIEKAHRALLQNHGRRRPSATAVGPFR